MSVIIIIFRDPGNIQWEIFSIPKICRLASSYTQDWLNLDPHFVLAVSDPRVYIICVDTRPRLQSCGAHDEFDRWAERRTHFTLLILTLNVSGRVWPVSGNIPLYFSDSLIEIYIYFLIIISTTHQGTISFIAHFSCDSTSSSPNHFFIWRTQSRTLHPPAPPEHNRAALTTACSTVQGT